MRLRLLGTLLLLSLALPSVCRAHPETGIIPDAIAEMEYRIVLDITPGDIQTRNKLGIVLYRKNKLKQAAQAFGEVLKSAPNDFDAQNGMGLVRMKEHKLGEALSWLKKAVAVSREDTMVHFDLGSAYETAGDLAQAETWYRKGLEVNASLIQRGINRDAETAKRTTLLNALRNLQDKIKTAKVTK